ncbi:protein translocase subunit SecF [Alkalicoccus urumqiensis]|uniref:Protein-export membrane protein SecF n=1 Tax=Alkalicoccus urumqiensis TaxID=1548213 RepID=A0A2P6MFJ2_ALKUR|nr:protein translocase subunit SecF [Alkalicoccus urumqiensis]PRO65011.1 protein translocase subunit SecF [Alkalicoccus urumqiensis]
MKFDHRESRLDFVKHRKKFFMFSAVFLLIGVILLSTLGLNLGIDFRSGTTVDVLAEDSVSEDEIASEFAEIGYEPDDIVLAGENNDIGRASFIGGLDQQESLEIQNHFEETYGNVPNVSTVTPIVGEELAMNAFISVLIASLGIILYVTIRFEFLYGISAIVALFHDALFILTIFSIVQMEVNIPFIAAVLTIIGYSINDTIVTFDRIRENMAKEKVVETFDQISAVVNKSLIQTLARSINTVLTVVFAAGALLLLGGEGLRVFSFALVVGLVAGTYSSLFIAAQLWAVLKSKQVKRRLEKERLEREAEEEASTT